MKNSLHSFDEVYKQFFDILYKIELLRMHRSYTFEQEKITFLWPKITGTMKDFDQ